MEGKEILSVVDSVSSEKGLEKEIIFNAMELALASASQRHFHEDASLVVEIDKTSGNFVTKRQWIVSDESDEDYYEQTHITPEKAEMEVGDVYAKEVENVEFGRIETQAARQVILQKVREAEKALIISQFKPNNNKLVSGVVKRVTRDNFILDLGQDAEAILPRDSILPGEIFKVQDRLRAVLQIKEVEGRGQQLMLSRICPEMVTELFRIEVPEVNEDVIEIRGVARDPGSRSKIAVKTNDGRIDPVGACVGMRGSRVQAVSNELGNERIDIVIFDDNPAQLVINAMAPAKIESIALDEATRSMEIAVDQENLALAIGSRGQNIRLASKLVGWELNVISNEEAIAREKVDETEFLGKLVDSLEVDEKIAEGLITKGFRSFDDIAYASKKKLMEILDDENAVTEIKGKAEDAALLEAMSEVEKDEQDQESLSDLELSSEDISKLNAAGINNKDDLAELATDELLEIIEISEEDASSLIMKSREHWFK